MKKLLKFLKTFAIFFIAPMLINMSMEMALGPENREMIATQGLAQFMSTKFVGISSFYAIFGLLGAGVYLKKGYHFKTMGKASLALGFIFEFLFMRPSWVRGILSLRINGGVIVAVIVSAFYWWIVWGLPSYVIQKYKLAGLK